MSNENNEAALVELQSQLAFQEHTIEQLNAVLVSQQQQMDLLKMEIRLLKDKLSTLEDRVEVGGSARDEKPPHY